MLPARTPSEPRLDCGLIRPDPPCYYPCSYEIPKCSWNITKIPKVFAAEVQKHAATDSPLNPCDAQGQKAWTNFGKGVGVGILMDFALKVPIWFHIGKRLCKFLSVGTSSSSTVSHRSGKSSQIQHKSAEGWSAAASVATCRSSVQSMSTYDGIVWNLRKCS